MRSLPAGLPAGLLAGLLLAGCTSATAAAPTPPGCGMVPASRVVGLLGTGATSTARGSVAGLRRSGAPLSCTSTVPGHPERSVVVRAERHPQPYRLPSRSCDAGWVFAGTPEKYAPACQEVVDGHGRTRLVVRWQPYLVRVTVARSDRRWGGDPEAALELSRALAADLGVAEARDR
jgi:hypothetical protein